MVKKALLPLLAAFLVAVGVSASADAARSVSPPPGLTASGQAVWNFEALLRETFGAKYKGCLRSLSRYVETFTKDSYCATHPASDTMFYSFTFAHPSGSPYHLVERTFTAGAFGNYPEPIRVETAYVACDAAGTTYLISYGDVIGLSANLACSKP